MMQDQNYKDASKLLNQVFLIFDGWPKMSGVVVMEDAAFPINLLIACSLNLIAWSNL